MTLRAISARLADEGILGPSGKPYFLRSIQLMLEERRAQMIGHSLTGSSPSCDAMSSMMSPQA